MSNKELRELPETQIELEKQKMEIFDRKTSEFKELIDKYGTAWAERVKDAPKQEFRYRLILTGGGFVIIAGILWILVELSSQGKIGGDAIVFLLGSITGYLFSFLQLVRE